MASVVEIWRYPVKSMAGERLDSCAVTEGGLEGDRRWAFIDQSPARAGKWFNIKQHAPLMTYHARLRGGALDLVAPDGSNVELDGALVRRFEAEAQRPIELRELPGENFDAAHVLIVNLATVQMFALEAGMAIDPRRFRANLYVEGLEPEAELGWLGRVIRAGDAELEVVDRCERCKVITMDPDTTEAKPELLRILVEKHDERLGMYCRVVRPGRVAVGDFVG
ncbi:MAG TPA: MOSC N-terminal beta barrel domain-containing protein [Candidatus Dormibacteraeota bacterium]|nr:MOSC N-terminal beta barrel domain-containing protein [Candidatus Dormibacteraeota bacterium]